LTVRKGEGWGEPGRLAEDGIVAHSDAEVRRVVERARRAGQRPPPLGLAGGDLCRTLGGRGDVARLRSGEAARLSVDLGAVLLDGRLHWFVAHLVARRSWWRGPLLAAMNAEFLGDWDVAPRAHPNDGLLDLVAVGAEMTLTDRIKARRRLSTGGHVPHPAIAQSRRPAFQIEFDRPAGVWLDGERVAAVTKLAVRVEPDALICVV
jgi:hypothetical protein